MAIFFQDIYSIEKAIHIFTFCLFLLLQTMTQMNKVMDPQKTMQMMKEFERENAKMEMTEEMSKIWESLSQFNISVAYRFETVIVHRF